jgi:hypothetical protein
LLGLGWLIRLMVASQTVISKLRYSTLKSSGSSAKGVHFISN